MASVVFLPISIIILSCLLINVARTLLQISGRAMQKHARGHISHRSCSDDDAADANDLHETKYAFKVKVPGNDEVAVECAFCLSGDEDEGDEIRQLKCGHLFHRACLDKWSTFATPPATCPLCRSPVAPMDQTAASTSGHFRADEEEKDDSLAILFSYVDVNGCFSRICEKLRACLDSVGCRAMWIRKGF